MTPKPSATEVIKRLESKQWGLGNGQCWDCGGLKPGLGWCSDTVGHLPNCARAAAIELLGGDAIWEHPNKFKSTGRCP